MGATESPPAELSDCCQAVNPCHAVCMIDNAMVEIITGKKTTSYQLGDKKFTMKIPTVSELKSLRAHFKDLCNESKGLPKRRRLKGFRLKAGEPWCAIHMSSGCGCGWSK